MISQEDAAYRFAMQANAKETQNAAKREARAEKRARLKRGEHTDREIALGAVWAASMVCAGLMFLMSPLWSSGLPWLAGAINFLARDVIHPLRKRRSKVEA